MSLGEVGGVGGEDDEGGDYVCVVEAGEEEERWEETDVESGVRV